MKAEKAEDYAWTKTDVRMTTDPLGMRSELSTAQPMHVLSWGLPGEHKGDNDRGKEHVIFNSPYGILSENAIHRNYESFKHPHQGGGTLKRKKETAQT